MTAQLANGGTVYPTIVPNNNSIENIKKEMQGNRYDLPSNYPSLVRNKENVKFVLDAMFKSTNEVYGTSYSSE